MSAEIETSVLVSDLDRLIAERDRYRAEWEEAARHALRWQAEYDTARDAIAAIRALCAHVEASPEGWGGPMVVSFARTVVAAAGESAQNAGIGSVETAAPGPAAAACEHASWFCSEHQTRHCDGADCGCPPRTEHGDGS